jgi:voltage-gated potassium channel Kch
VRRLTLRQRLRYRFDNLMARGARAQVLMLALLSLALILATAIAVRVAGLVPLDNNGQPAPESFVQNVWRALNRTIDTGNVGGDQGSWPFLVIMMLATFGGIFVVSAFIGIVSAALEKKVESLRKGKSLVAEHRHTVVLGYTPKIHTLLAELAEANANVPHACVVILADRDKVEMDDEIRQRLRKRLKVVTRSGSPMSVADLEIANLSTAKAVIVMSPEHDGDGEPLQPHESDTIVLKTLLAITKDPAWQGHEFHVVAELLDEKIMQVARMVVGERAALLLAPPLIGRLLVQTGRKAGLSAVFTELLDFGGSEIYIQPEPALAGKRFRDALAAYDDSALIGLLAADGRLLLPPAFDYALQAGDQVIAISEDDDTVVVNGRGRFAGDDALLVREVVPMTKRAERNLVLGTSERLSLVLRELAPYTSEGSVTLVVGEDDALGREAAEEATRDYAHLGVVFRHGDITDRAELDRLEVATFEHVLVLSETAGRHPDVADARTMVTLLHLRDIIRRSGKTVPVTSEILEIQNRELAAVAEADDFIVSNTLVALMVAQLAENRHLVRVFDELFTYGGHDIRIKPADQYVVPDAEVDFYAVLEAAARRDEIAIGYRMGARAHDASHNFGVVVNPRKSDRIRLGHADQVVVLTQVS